MAILRAASLGALPLAALADRFGRHRVLYACAVAGLCVTASAALSPSYWWFVALFALARPALSATNILTGVVTAELTSPRSRATALVDRVGGRGGGCGDVGRGPWGPARAQRVPDPVRHRDRRGRTRRLAVRRLPETHGALADTSHAPRLGSIPTAIRSRLAVVMAVTAAVGAISGPAGGFAFVYWRTTWVSTPRR